MVFISDPEAIREINEIRRESTGLFLDPLGQSCRARAERTEVFEFTDAGLQGTITTRYELDSGVCSRPYPCVVVIVADGRRCRSCFPGCN